MDATTIASVLQPADGGRIGNLVTIDPEIGYVYSKREQEVVLSVFLQIFEEYHSKFGPTEKSAKYAAWAKVLKNIEHNYKIAMRVAGMFELEDESDPSHFDSRAIAEYVTKSIRNTSLEAFLKKHLASE